MNEPITEDILIEILDNIEADYQGTPFLFFYGNHEGRLWVQVGTERACAYTGESGIGKGGKAYVSPYATDDEVVKKIFGLCLAYTEHETREGFLYRGRRLFNPHISLEALMSIAKKTNYRKGS